MGHIFFYSGPFGVAWCGSAWEGPAGGALRRRAGGAGLDNAPDALDKYLRTDQVDGVLGRLHGVAAVGTMYGSAKDGEGAHIGHMSSYRARAHRDLHE